ncbi:MAG TPA: SBBP repeat-containing protein [Candidatus Acidoferrales bacterium]|nr:SBBP repeat-containing protein [Candidatus Acidoferrales bacterium]
MAFEQQGEGKSLLEKLDAKTKKKFEARKIGGVLTRLHQRQNKRAVHIGIDGANPEAQIEALDELPGKSNYFIGSDRSKWLSGIPNYSRVRYRGIYPGVDLIYYGNQGQLEFDFVVSPGGDPKSVALKFDRHEHVTIASDGSLQLGLKQNAVLLHRPNVYQIDHGSKRSVNGEFVFLAGGRVGIRIGSYDRTKPLVIDPVLTYSSYLGANNGDADAEAIAVDSRGVAYVAGSTSSTNFPVFDGYQSTGPTSYLAFVAELDPSGSYLMYSTYLGGTSESYGQGIAIDANTNVYVTGYTFGTDFPVVNGFQLSNNNPAGGNAFIARIDTTQTGTASLVYSSYLGGGGNPNNPNPWFGDLAMGIAADSAGRAYVTGTTTSDASVAPFPTTSNAYQSSLASPNGNAFLTVVDTNQSGAASLVYSTYLGGDGTTFGDFGVGITADTSGDAYIVGQSTSDASGPFPTTPGAYQSTLNSPNGNVFLAEIATTQSGSASLVYSTYLGGSTTNLLGDYGGAIALDSVGKVYIAGDAGSSDFPISVGAFQIANSANGKAFVAKFDLSQSGTQSLVYSTFLGGTNSSSGDTATGIAVDANGDAFVTGTTSSTDFPTTSDAFQLTLKSTGANVFLTEINPNGTTDLYSTYLGGSSAFGDLAMGVALDALGNPYVVGTTESVDFPTTTGAFQATITPNPQTGFVAKFALIANPQITAGMLPSPNSNGWNNSPVTVNFTCTPGPAPIQSCSPPVIVRTEGANQVASGTVVDDLNNTSTTTASVNLDMTAPSITIASPSSGASVSTGSVTVTGTIADTLSGPGSVTCHGTQAALSGSSFSCSVQLSSGVNSITVIGSDLAGNASSASVSVTNTGASGQTNPPTLSGISPNQGGIDSVVTLAGSAFGAAQGSSVVMFNGIAAQVLSWSNSNITATVPPGLNPGVVTVSIGVNGSASNAVQFTVTQPLFITPNQITMLVGSTQPIQLVDENGVSVSGATWSVGNTTVAQINPPANGQPTLLQADAVGITTLVGSYGNRTAVATVTVLPAGSALPNGAVLWSVPSLGPYGMRKIVNAAPGVGAPAVYAEDDGAYGGNGAIRAFDANGQQLWIWPPSSSDAFPLLAAGDNQGGAIYFASQDNPNQYDSYCYFGHVDENGNETWQYQETNCREDYGIAPDGTIFLVEPEFQNNGTVTVTALNPATGQMKFTVTMPGAGQNTSGADSSVLYDTNTDNYYTYCTPGTSGTTNYDTFANVGAMSIDANGNVYIPFSTSIGTSDASGCDSSPDPNDPGYPHKVKPTDGNWTFSQSFQMMTIHPDGTYSTQQLDSASGSGTNAGGGSSGGFRGFERAIPDGQGGELVPIYSPPTLYHVSSLGISKFSLPVQPPGFFDGFLDPDPLILGENSTAFLTGASSQYSYPIDTVLAINTNTGAISWSHTSQGNTVSLVTATSDGGVTINDSQLGFVQLDNSGNGTPTNLTGSNSSLTSSWQDGWYALNVAGTNGVSAVSLSSRADYGGPWAQNSGNPSSSHAQPFVETLFLRSFARWAMFGPDPFHYPWCLSNCFYGNNRGFSTYVNDPNSKCAFLTNGSTTVTSKISGMVWLLLPQLTIIGKCVYSDQTEDKWGDTATAFPGIKTSVNADGSLHIEIWGSNPLTPHSITPDINTKLDISGVVSSTQVCYSGKLYGDQFPDSEVFVYNSQAQPTMLQTFQTSGDPNTGVRLILGDNNRPMGSFNAICITPK